MQPDSTEQQTIPPTEPIVHYPVFTTDGMPGIIAKKVAGLVEQLNSDVVNIVSLKAFLGEGIPDEAALIRQYTWKLILGYLPPQRAKWNDVIAKQQHTYRGLVHMFLPPEKFPQHPIPLKKNHPRFEELEEDYLLWEQIEKDTSRTHAEFSFFATECPPIMVPYFTSARKEKFKLIYGDNDEAYKSFLTDQEKQRKTYRYDHMSRILYVYSKLNPRIQYVQGMNQILAPIFYLVNITRNTLEIDEAACFFMFNNAICDIIELHIKDLDKSHSGIYGKLNEVNQMLMVVEPEIWERMESLKIDPFFYCFRWVTLLYAQDFELFDTIRLWQSIFAAPHKLEFINYIAIAIIKQCQRVIMEQEFTTVLEYLQDLRSNVAIHTVIGMASQYAKLYEDTDYQEEGARVKKTIEKKRKKEEKHRQKEEERAEKEHKKHEKKEKQRLQREEEQREKAEEGGEGNGESGEADIAEKLKKRTSSWFKKVGNAVNKLLN